MTNVNYWKAVYGCALHGKLEIVRSLLALHSKASHKAFIAAEDVIKSMPVYSVYGGYTANEFMVRWKHWQKDVISLIDSKTFVIDDKLEALMKVRHFTISKTSKIILNIEKQHLHSICFIL